MTDPGYRISGLLDNAVTMPIGVDRDGDSYYVIVGEVVPRHGERNDTWDAFAHDWSIPDNGTYRPIHVGTFTDRRTAVEEVRGRAPSRYPRPGDRMMQRHHLVPQDPSPAPWNAHRLVNGQRGYIWTYVSPHSDVRLVYRHSRGPSPTVAVPVAAPVAVGTVRTYLPDSEARYAAYTTNGEWIAASNNPAALATVVALHDLAAQLATQRAVAEVSRVTADRTAPDDLDGFRRCVERDDWPSWATNHGRSQRPLSGRDGDPTPLTLLHELDVDPDPDGTIQVDLALRYTNAFRQTWREEFLRIARERIGTE